ncbi:MAG: ABC transporter permease [Ancalomicrobiaceae bacterium]|nr:ABC transporter permease [Ancalomicrobiaceae bacterium]
MSAVPSLARWRDAAPALFLAVLVAVITVATPDFAQPGNLLGVLADTATLFVLAAGMTFVILIGGIDLAAHTIASLSSVVVALLLPTLGYGAFPVALAVGFASGLFSGVVHVRLHVPSFIATLATSGVVSGVALLVSDARTISIDAAGRSQLAWITGSVAGVPAVVLIAAAVFLACAFVQRFTRFGRRSLAIGAGEPAAWASGIRVGRQKIIAFALCGTLAALAGALLAGRLSAGTPVLGNQLLLPAIASVIVGGTAITGGAGGIGRTLIGALIITVVRIGMTFVGVNIFAQQVVFGLVLIAAVAVTIDRTKIPIVK